MINSFVTRPATTVMFVLFFALLGFVAMFNINVERQPRIDFPLVSISVVYPGADPEEIEGQVLKEIEDVVATISEIKKMESRALDSMGYIIVEFNLGVDVNDKSAEIKEKIDGILINLPTNIEKPVVAKVDPFATPVVWLSLSSDNHSMVELYEFADKKLSDQFTKITGVGEVNIFGGQERQVRVELSPDLMRKKYISVDGVIGQLRARNLDVPAGDIKKPDNTIAVRFEGKFNSIESIANLRLTSPDGNQFTLKEVANVYDGAADPEYAAAFNGQDTVVLGIVKISDGNDVKVSEGVKQTLKKIDHLLEDGMNLKVVNDTSTFIVDETNRTIEGIIIGILLTVLVLLFFTGDWRITLISAIVIPSSIISSLFLVEASGFSINFMTLLAFATALGTLVANAIVVIESIDALLKKGVPVVEAAITGTKAVTIPVLAACGTNIVVFAPLSFMDGIVGQFMVQFGMTVIYATIFSLMASFTLTPMLCAVMLKPTKANQKENFLVRTSNSFTNFIKYEYKVIFDLMFKAPILSGILAIGLFIFGVSVAPYVGGEFIPTSDEDKVQVMFKYPLGTRVDKTMDAVKAAESKLRELPGIKSSLIVAGNNGQENANIILLLEPSAQRKHSDVKLIEMMTPLLADVPDAEIEIVRGDGSGGDGTGDISINVSGVDYDKTVELSNQMLKIMMDSGYFRSLTSSHRTPKTQISFTPDAQKIERFGLNNARLGEVIRSSIYGDDSNIYREKGEQYKIFIESAKPYKDSLTSLNDLFIVSNFGLTPLTELGAVEVKPSTPTIFRRDRSRVIQLNAYISKSNASDIMADLTAKFNALNIDDGYSYAFVGSAEYQAESGRELGKAFLLAVIFTYMVMAAIMNSFAHPFTISTSIVTSFAGVFLFLFFMSSTMNIASMLGMVMLVGLAVNNAILMLEEVELIKVRKPDQHLRDTIWEGIDNRFRAILMSSLTIVFGALPQLWSIDLAKVSMGAVIVGGILASILFTFILTPQAYYIIEKSVSFVKRKLRPAEI
ncbi:MAG: efflux RND transporter permease subunit [Bdellovibrionaceae bacterium]|nr:efflux RND transporter permease subunit [Pseudobdellovibrionaceae bacterium]